MKFSKYILFFLLNLAVHLAADESGVIVRPADNEMIDSEPKQVITVVFRVTNATANWQEFASELVLPEGWKPITHELPFYLEPKQSDSRLVSLYVPAGTRVGRHSVAYKVFSRQFPSISDQYTVFVNVLPVYKLSVEVIEEPKNAVSGETYDVTFWVTSLSNTADSVLIKMTSDRGFKLSPNVMGIHFKAGESRVLSVKVHVDPKIDDSFKHRLDISARFAGEEKNAAYASSYVEIIPLKPAKVDRYHRLPVNIALRHVFHNRNTSQSVSQVDVYGSGSLDEARQKNVSFRVRTPDIYETSILGERDEFFAEYSDKRWTIQAGDRNYSISPLLEFGRYGRGGGIRYASASGLGVGGYAQSIRWLTPNEKQAAGYVSYSYQNKHSIQFNALSKWLKDGEDAETRHNIFSVQTRTVPYARSEVDLEYAIGSKSQTAYWLQFSGNHDRINYHFNRIVADKDFPGYYRNIKLTSGNLSARIWNTLRLETNVRQNEDRFDQIDHYAVVLNRYANAGIRYSFKKGPSFSLGFGSRSQEDRQPVPLFDYGERLGLFEIFQTVKSLGWQARAELGRTRNRLTDKTSQLERYTMSLQFRPFAGQLYQANLYYDNNQHYIGERQRQWNLGFNASIAFSASASMNINYQNYFSPDMYYADRNVCDVFFKYTFPNKHVLSFKARRTILRNSIFKRESAVMVQYNLPIAIPTGQVKNVGIVRGSVIDVLNLKPVEGVIVRINGSTAVTDKQGRFQFHAMKPNTYYLRIEKAKIGLDRITVQKTPLVVRVAGGDEQDVTIGITRSAKLKGRVVVYRVINDSSDHFSSHQMKKYLDDYFVSGNGIGQSAGAVNNYVTNGKTKLVPDYGLLNATVELKRDDEIQRRLTDANGEFSIEDIRPGKWTLKVYDFNVPENFSIKQNDFELEFKPGEEKTQLIQVMPKRRRIQFIEEGGTVETIKK